MIVQLAITDPVITAVDSLKLIYTIVLSLAIGEAFRNFVSDHKSNGGNDKSRSIQLDRSLLLIAFLFLAIPFVHGMNQYFYYVYVNTTAPRPDPYAGYLLTDAIVFTIEAGLFFIMSHMLRSADCEKFVVATVILLGLNILWLSFVAWRHTPSIVGWAFVNACTIPFLLAVWFSLGRYIKKWWQGPSLVLAILAVRTVADYSIAWSFYFPRPPSDTVFLPFF